MLLSTSVADAKDFGVASPNGKRTYAPEERFVDVIDQNARRFVMEVAVGLGADGNLAMVLGWLVPQLDGFELYAGLGLDITPARHITGSFRYWLDIFGFEPYLGAGYVFRRLTDLETATHDASIEVGYKWRLHTTFHVTLSLGVRLPIETVILEDSPLKGPDIDPVLLEEELARTSDWVPTLALRFSRAF